MKWFLKLPVLLFLLGCIGEDIIDDIVQEDLDIIAPELSIHRNVSYAFQSRYLDQTGIVADADVSWKVSDPSVATIDADGVFKATGNGSVTITLELSSNPTLSDDVSVTVWPNPKITNPIDIITLGFRKFLNAVYVDSLGNENMNDLMWTSSDSAIVEINEFDTLIAKSVGTVTITVSKLEKGLSESFELEVVQVQPGIELINPPIVDLKEAEEYQIDFVFRDENLMPIEELLNWSSSDVGVAIVSKEGLITPVSPGDAIVTVSRVAVPDEKVSFDITVVENPDLPQVRSGQLATTTFYDLGGDFTISNDPEGGIILDIAANYFADDGLPGLYVYLSNNPNTTNGALEIGAVKIFQGAHQYKIPMASLREYDYVLYYCKPFNVKVGDGEIN